jgi:uncharacterized membrane protein YphA (DoxX/SURF4 family)
MTTTLNKYLLMIVRLFLGLVFVLASIDKIVAPEAFAASIQAYKLVPLPFVNIFAIIIPWIELICGILLMVGVKHRSSSIIVSMLLAVFTIAIISALLRNLNIDCGCYGKEHATPISWMKVLEDVGLMVMGIYIFYFTKTDQSIPEQASVTGV